MQNFLPLPELAAIHDDSLGDERVAIAILDGPVDLSHSCFKNASLTAGITEHYSEHGTHIASIIFGQPHSPVMGIAPRCRGFVVPIFQSGAEGAVAPCTQAELARAILQAIELGAHVINISGGRIADAGDSEPLLRYAVAQCAEREILIVAAAGNDGCRCLHMPAALPAVIVAGAMDNEGAPLEFSNWGDDYQQRGLLVPGKDILGAIPRNRVALKSGTSFAAAILSGCAALLLSIQLKYHQRLDTRAVRQALFESARPCQIEADADCRRVLAGKLNIAGAYARIIEGEKRMAEDRAAAIVAQDVQTVQTVTPPAVRESVINPSEGCGCANKQPAPLVYALGKLGYDFGTMARQDSFRQAMSEETYPEEQQDGETHNKDYYPHIPEHLLKYLEYNPWSATNVIWTLNLDGTPVYAVTPNGAYAEKAYERIREFLREQLIEGVERISVAGRVTGTVRLYNGQTVPVITPEIRGMYSWTTAALAGAVVGALPEDAKEEEKESNARKRRDVADFLNRVYHEMRNMGLSPHERAINFSVTNAFQAAKVFESALKDEMQLDNIEVEKSPLCRPESDCYDVKLIFFDPERQHQRARKVYRFTVDVSDVVPVTIGEVRSWAMY